jgi:serine phosphatase RsbU (regulator of sigma subunit)
MMVLAFYADSDSICWIGGSEGLYRFDRKLMTSTENKFATLIRKVRINQDSTIFFGAFPQEITSVIGKVWSANSNNVQLDFMKLKIPYFYNDLIIEYAAPNFTDESNTLYSYFMEGYDENWSTWSKLTQKEYTNLREGTYLFKVKAKDVLGNESEIASYEFTILPPWYRAWWAYLMYVCVSGLVIWQIVRFNSARLKLQNEILEKIVIERTAEIETKRQEVEKSYENVQLLNEIGQKITASLDLDKVLNTLYENVNELMDAAVFGIGLYDKTAQQIHYRLAIAKGVRYLPYTRDMTDKNQFPVWCIENKADVFIVDVFVEYKKYINYYKELDTISLEDGTFEDEAYSMLYTPIFSNQEVIGIITVQSYKKNAYTNYHLSMLKSLAVYTAIALENADTFHQIETQKQEIDSINEELSVTLQVSDKHRHELAEKNADIIASINYAKRIQNAMMPTQETIDKHLGKDSYFVLFKPRDIVSGDFYWIREVNNKILVVVADCTGHGVPGAFVSMVGNSTLNEITKRGLSHTHLILNKLHKEISLFFNQNTNVISTEYLPTTENLKVQDGMDISMISIDKETKIVEYAGAKNPLYYVMNGEMHEIKADKYSIGGYQEENEAERMFEKHIVRHLTPPLSVSPPAPEGGVDTITSKTPPSGVGGLSVGLFYLFTDGFQDQFGGEKNKKFMTKRFRELLFSISHLPMAEQKQILSRIINEWIGEGEQTDDITVMGVRI